MECIVGVVLEKNGTEFTIKRPSYITDKPIVKTFALEANIAASHSEYNVGEIIQGLVFRKMRKEKNRMEEETTLGLIRKIEPEDVIIHILSSYFYYIYLARGSLELCTASELKDNILNAIKKVQAFMKQNYHFSEQSIKHLETDFLKGYFRNIENRIYYIPYLFRNYTDRHITQVEYTKKAVDDKKVTLEIDGNRMNFGHLGHGINKLNLCEADNFRNLLLILNLQKEIHRTGLNNLKVANSI